MELDNWAEINKAYHMLLSLGPIVSQKSRQDARRILLALTKICRDYRSTLMKQIHEAKCADPRSNASKKKKDENNALEQNKEVAEKVGEMTLDEKKESAPEKKTRGRKKVIKKN